MAIMREHGGIIEARTLAEGGALFTLTFPVANGDAHLPQELQSVSKE
jgi:signal transduction histidine kinase